MQCKLDIYNLVNDFIPSTVSGLIDKVYSDFVYTRSSICPYLYVYIHPLSSSSFAFGFIYSFSFIFSYFFSTADDVFLDESAPIIYNYLLHIVNCIGSHFLSKKTMNKNEKTKITAEKRTSKRNRIIWKKSSVRWFDWLENLKNFLILLHNPTI